MWGENVPAVGTERQRIDRRHRIDRKRPVKMGEKLAAARRLPLQGVSQPVRRHAQQHQAGLAGAMPGGAFDDLGGCREMDEAVGGILGGAGIAAGELGCRPLLLPAHMMDDGVADHGRDTSGNRSGIKGRDSFAKRLRPFVAETGVATVSLRKQFFAECEKQPANPSAICKSFDKRIFPKPSAPLAGVRQRPWIPISG